MHVRADMDVPVEVSVWTATGQERPVFLDEHGRRRRWVLLGGALTGGASAFWLGALVAGAIGFSNMPSLQSRTPLLASRSAAPHPVSYVHPRHARHASALRRAQQPLGAATELAVSTAH